jgi:aspartyl protease family protein
MFRMLMLAGCMLAAGVLAVRFVDNAGRAAVAAKPAAVTATEPESANSRTFVVKAGQDGHFAVEARVDGRRLDFMVDTGASHIALRESDAGRLGIHPIARDYSIRISTANGEGRAARVELRSVEVGNIIVRDLVALVVPDEALTVNLLGMSFLSRVRWAHEKGKLVLEQ